MKNKISYNLATATVIAMAIIPIALAAPIFSNNLYQKCDEAVYPYISGATAQQISYSNADLNHSLESACQNHLVPSFQGATFPNVQHVQPVDSVSHPDVVTSERSVPVAHHEHHYVNESVDNDGFYKRAWLRSFEIKLQPDLKAALLQGSLKCPIPNDGINPLDNGFASCNHTNPNVFGGTSVNFDGTTVKYTFGLNQPQNGYKPIIPGSNAAIDQGIFFPGDTTKAENRLFGMTLVFTTKDRTLENPSKTIWSATTTSRAEVIHTAIPKTAFDSIPAGLPNTESNKGKYHACNEGGVWNASNSWCNYEGYVWANIGSDISIWKAPTQQTSECIGMELSGPGELKKVGTGLYEYVPDEDATFNVLPSFSNGTVPLDYRWQAEEFKINWAGIGSGSASETSKVQLPGGNTPIEAALPRDLFAAVASPADSMSPGMSQNVTTSPLEGMIPYIVDYGDFFDSFTHFQTNPTSGKNPYVDGGNIIGDDRSSYYTGGPEGTLVTVQGVDPAAPDVYAPEAYVGNNCQAMIIIPKEEIDNTCIDLEITPDKAEPYTPVTFTVTPSFEDPANPIPLDYLWKAVDTAPYTSFSDFSLNNKVQVQPELFDIKQPEYSTSPFDPGFDIMGETNLLAALPSATIGSSRISASSSISASAGAVPITETMATPSFEKVISSADNFLPLPDKDLFGPVVLGFFENFLGAGDLDNPYWERTDNKTHYTGGQAGTWISVQAYGKDGTLYPMCKESLQIPPDDTKECLDLEIMRNGQIVPAVLATNEPTDNLYVNVSTKPAAYLDELDYIWNTTGGNLTSGGQSGATLTTQDPSTTVNLLNPDNGTILSVYARDPAEPNKVFMACADSLTMQEAPQNMCLNLQLSNSNPNLRVNQSTRLIANPINQTGPHPGYVRWSEQGAGHFELGPSGQTINNVFPGTCPQAPATANQSFTAPKECDYVYFAGPNAGDSFRVEAVPNIGNVADCIYTYTVPATPPGKPYCVDLNLNPDLIMRGARTNYTGEATFSDGKTYNVDVDWSGQNGTFSNNSTFHRQQNVSSAGFANYFNHTPADASGRVEAAVSRVYSSDVSDNFSLCREVITIPPDEEDDECTYLYLRWPYDGLVCIGTDHEGNFIWGKNGTEWESDELCIEATEDDEITVEAIGYEEVCSDEYSPDEPPPEYELIKLVNVKNDNEDGFTTKIQTIPQDHTTVWYKLIFTPKGAESTTVTITDDISKGFLLAEILPVDKAGNLSPGRITYDDNLVVTEEGYGELPNCALIDIEEGAEAVHCYNGDIGDGNGIQLVGISGEVTIQYRAKVESGLTDEICREGQVCEEKYRNSARAKVTKVNGKSVDIPTIRSNDIEIQIFCQYILTQAAGDIFLERDLSYGIDIQQCSEISTSPGIVITPGTPKPPKAPGTGPGETEIFTVSHELCTAGLAGDLPAELLNIYGQDVVPRLSGQICEVRLPTGSDWKQSFITNSIDENKTRLSRWGADINNSVDIGLFSASDYLGQSVFHVRGGNLTVSREYVLNDGEGAKTFIVEDGNLIIKNNIKYGPCPAGETCTVNDTASLAFIVLNGSVYIDHSVTEIAGVFFVQEGEDLKSGRFYSGTGPDNFGVDSMETLKVTGSVYGDIDPLFGSRKYAGDPLSGDGGIVIRFDQRIILNTPPGLRDVLNLTQTEVAR